MSDPAIKLFGKTIQLLHPHKQQQQQCCDKEFKGTLEKEQAPTQTEDTRSHPSIDESINQPTSLVIGINDDDPKTPTTEKETSSKSTTKKDNPIENANSEERAPKPDKIIPCPRCNSMDTKFCYYNNYNVNQPRHFCKNCQRYWTAGGTMRNTPVGSGRRKNKSSPSASSYYRHLIVSEALHPALKSSGSVLNFGSHVPLCESMNSALNFSDKSQKAEDDRSSSVSNSVEKRETNGLDHFQGYPIQIPCFPHPAPPWPYRGPPGIPVNFYPAPQYWGCTVQVPPSPWSMQYIAPTSPLGKHSRDGNLLSPSSSSRNEVSSKDKNSESSILVPKTLRINEPNEAAKNSLWPTLGFSKEGLGYNTSSVNGGNLCKAFQPKSDEKNEVDVTSLANLQANPAALSRSHNFRETS